MKVGVIGGSGVYSSRAFQEKEVLSPTTPYGEAGDIFRGSFSGLEIYFLPRHGREHTVPPHRVNYRANIYALKEEGVERIIALNSVGSVNPAIPPGSLVVPHDLLDFTRRRESTFYNDRVVHVDMSEPYCPEVRGAIIEASRKVRGEVFEGVYAATEGPRFETPAEVNMLSRLGADVVGMTGMPEVALAREQEMCYSALCISANLAAGIKGEKLTAREVIEVVREGESALQEVIKEALLGFPGERNCNCKSALEEAEM